MLKVFLAEDEFVVREGIKNNIDWNGAGYEFCGEAGDGELAYSMIQKLRPDILITDIKMPFMDGLALSRMVKAQFPNIEIILLTGYEDFEFAKEAIKIGVSSYLSKPISGENLLKEIGVVAEKLEEKNRELEIRRMYEEDMKERTELDKHDFFEDLVKGSRDLPYILKRAKELDIDISGLSYNIILLKIWSIKHESGEFSNTVVKVADQVADLVEEMGGLIFDMNLDSKAILLKGDFEKETNEAVSGIIERMKELFSQYPNIRYFGGVGKPVERITDIPTSFKLASRAFAHLYLNTGNDFLVGSEGAVHSKGDDIIISEIDPRHIDRRHVKEFLRRGEESEAEYFLEEFFEGMGQDALRSNMLRQYIAMDVYFCVADFVENDLLLNRSELGDQIPAADLLGDEQKTKDFLVDILKKAVTLRKDSSQGGVRDVVKEVIAYIDENYSDDELSLNKLAAHVNFSPNHLSAVFRQETGQPFIKYLTDFRLEKAKELLLETSKKSSEISLLVGYKDPHYFSYLFKKTQGMTTTQYRGKGRVEGDE
ncbi:response regulator [Butyrivibrio sp. CB08]|uniref:response regulator n=1 Tax=Butyrivibrio sp. CB08 TaxID=2364879 RepID=UPI001FA9D7C8|nr:response regulator [Butyrivibrio sp. CB08]